MRHPTSPPRRAGQQGVSLIFALIALLLIGLSTLALVRSVDTGSLVLGNMSFKQDATAAADQGVRTAFNWLKVQTSNTLGADNAAAGYYASTRDTDSTKPLDVTGHQFPGNANRQLIDWNKDQCAYSSTGTCGLTPTDPAVKTPNGNNSLRYTIFRLCSMTDAAATAAGTNNNCASPAGQSGTVHEAGKQTPSLPASGWYYRIVVRVQGSRNSESFIEAIVQL